MLWLEYEMSSMGLSVEGLVYNWWHYFGRMVETLGVGGWLEPLNGVLSLAPSLPLSASWLP
jgi:hypothetical protein